MTECCGDSRCVHALHDYTSRRLRESEARVERLEQKIEELELEIRMLRHTCECSSEEACAHVRRAEEAEAKLDEWLQFEERSGWALKEFCRGKCPIKEIQRLRDRLQFDPGGSDKIDELEQALQFVRHDLEVEKAAHELEKRERERTWEHRNMWRTKAERLQEAVSAAYLFLAPLTSSGNDSLDQLAKQLHEALLAVDASGIINVGAVHQLEIYGGEGPSDKDKT